MKMSLRAAVDSATFAQTWLYSVKVLDDESANVQSSGLSVGDVIPAQDVTEHLFDTSYAGVHIGPDLELKFPVHINFLKSITITFNDSEWLVFHNFLVDWSTEVHSNQGFKDLAGGKFLKKFQIAKYTRESDGPVLESIYHCGLPEGLQYKGSNNLGLMENSVELPVFRVVRKMDVV